MSSPLWDAMREGCGSCEFAGPASSAKQHECRRRPPVIIVVNYSAHGQSDQVEQHRPWMAQDDWCGEWKRKQKAPNEA